jgi:hypothetical protein
MNFLFIHVPKCGGTTIFHQLPNEYNKKFYGQYFINNFEINRKNELKNFDGSNPDNWPKKSINNYYLKEKINFDYLKNYNYICIDHLNINDLINCNIINEKELFSKEIIVFWRNPIDRFLSICNWFKITIDELIERLKNPNLDIHTKVTLGRNTWYQQISDIIKYKNEKIKTTNYLLDNFNNIQNKFKEYNINIKNIKLNKSSQKINKNNLNEKQLLFIHEFYKDDFINYNKLLNNKI